MHMVVFINDISGTASPRVLKVCITVVRENEHHSSYYFLMSYGYDNGYMSFAHCLLFLCYISNKNSSLSCMATIFTSATVRVGHLRS